MPAADVTPSRPDFTPDITAAVEAGTTIKDKIVNVCEVLQDPQVQTQRMLDILAAYGLEPSREHVQKTIAPWRKRHLAAQAAAEAEAGRVHTTQAEDSTPAPTSSPVGFTWLTSENTPDRSVTTADMPKFTRELERQFEADFAALQEELRASASAGVNSGHPTTHTVNGTVFPRAGVADRPWQKFTPPVAEAPGGVHTLPAAPLPEFTPSATNLHTPTTPGASPRAETGLTELSFAASVHTPSTMVAPAEAGAAVGQLPIADELERELWALHEHPSDGEPPTGEPDVHDGAERQAAPQRKSPAGEYLFYLAAAVPMITSLDTSWKLFERLGVGSPIERVAMFAGLELGFVACAVHMGLTIRKRNQEPSVFVRLVLWALCGISVYGAIVGAGMELGLARVLFGPAISMMMLHLALMAERRAHGPQKDTTLAKIGRELRERFLSRFGLGNDERDAAQRIKDRNSQHAAKLGAASFALFRRTRMRRAMRRAGVAHEPVMLERMLAEFDFEKHVDGLRTLNRPSPFAAFADQDRTTADAHR